MMNQRFTSVFLLSVSLCSFVLFACEKQRQNQYAAQLKRNLPAYDSISSVLITKFGRKCRESPVRVYPLKNVASENPFNFYDASIAGFCGQNKIDYPYMRPGGNNTDSTAFEITYYLSDNSYQYIFNNKGFDHNQPFENTRVRVLAVSINWQCRYEKPNF